MVPPCGTYLMLSARLLWSIRQLAWQWAKALINGAGRGMCKPIINTDDCEISFRYVYLESRKTFRYVQCRSAVLCHNIYIYIYIII